MPLSKEEIAARRAQYQGAQRSKFDRRDHHASRLLAHKYRLRWTRPIPVKDKLKWFSADSQGDTDACTAFALANLIELEYGIKYGKKIEVDAPLMYSRQTGNSKRQALDAAKKYGIPLVDGRSIELVEYARIPFKWTNNGLLEEIRFWFKFNKGIYVSADTYRDGTATNWGKSGKTGVVKFEGLKNGAHALVGFDADDEGITLLNSWGLDWGKYKNGTLDMLKEDLDNLSSDIWIIFINDNNIKTAAKKNPPPG